MEAKPPAMNSKTSENDYRDPESWDMNSFSESTNFLLKEMLQYKEGADLIQLLQLLYKNHPEYGSISWLSSRQTKSPDGGLFQNLIVFLEKNQSLHAWIVVNFNSWENQQLDPYRREWERSDAITGPAFYKAIEPNWLSGCNFY